MRIALFSDVHGNLAALEAVLGALKAHGTLDVTVCAGDMVYLGPSPAEVLDRLQEASVQMVRGNSDDVVTGLRPPEEPPNPRIVALHRAHVAWNREQLSQEHLSLLEHLPFTLQFGSLLVCHSSPASNDDEFPQVHRHTAGALRGAYARPGVEAVAFGHWHVPGVTALGDLTLVNVSCVSIPMDGKAMAGYTIAERLDGFWRFQQHRVAYDLEPELRRMAERSMPEPPWPKGNRPVG